MSAQQRSKWSATAWRARVGAYLIDIMRRDNTFGWEVWLDGKCFDFGYTDTKPEAERAALKVLR